MGNNEGEKTPKPEKPEKPTTPSQDQSGVHVYPDWAAVQAYYGPGAIPPPYYNPAAAPGHAGHPYMWGPPQMVPPYGSYAAMYPHGGIYGASAAPVVTTPLTLETPTRSSGNDNGSAKKPKESEINSASGNGNAESAKDGGTRSHSTDGGTEGSCDRSDGGSTAREDDSGRSYNGASDSGACNMKIVPGIPVASNKPLDTCSILTPEVNHSHARTIANSIITPAPRATVAGVQGERELKREKRKQSNRESARRSRLRKQAEMEELGRKVDALTAENLALRSEINKLEADSDKLRSENGLLVEKLKKMQGQGGSVVPERNEDQENVHINTENLLEKVDNAVS